MSKHYLYDLSNSPVLSEFPINTSSVAPTSADNEAKGFANNALWITVNASGGYSLYVKTAESTAGSATWSLTNIVPGIQALTVFGNVNAAPTVAQLKSGLFSHNANSKTFTLPATTAIIAAIPNAITGSYFDFSVVNIGAGTSTVTAGDVNTTVVGDAAVSTATSATYRVLVTGAAAISVVRTA